MTSRRVASVISGLCAGLVWVSYISGDPVSLSAAVFVSVVSFAVPFFWGA